MTNFKTVPISVRGHRGLRLEFRVNEQDHRPIKVNLIPEMPVKSGPYLPFSYEFVDTTRGLVSPRMRIVAAPGVSVFFDLSVVPRSVDLPAIEIIRVQDPDLVPPIGVQTSRNQFLRDREYGEYMESARGTVYAANYLHVIALQDGLHVRHPFSESELSITVKSFTDDHDDLRDARDRFAFDVDPEGWPSAEALPLLSRPDPAKLERPLFTLVKTPSVEVRVSIPTARLAPEQDPRKSAVWFRVYEVERLKDVPVQGTEFPRTPPSSWRLVTSIDRDRQTAEVLGLAGADVMLGAIPLVGDMLDIVEFAYGLGTGRDKWGNPLSKTELALLGVAALLPFVTAGMAKVPALIRKQFGDRAATAREVLTVLERERPTSGERELIEQAVRDIERGVKPATEALEAARDLVVRAKRSPVAPESLLEPGGKGFSNTLLQEAYVRYGKGREAAKDPMEWIRATRQPDAIRVLKKELGEGYEQARRNAKFVDRRLFNPHTFPRPPTLTDERLAAAIADLDKDHGRLLERLTGRIGTGEVLSLSPLLHGDLIRGLKGNIGEILSHGEQMKALQKIALEHPGKTPVLIHGVMMKRVKKGGGLAPAKYFSDNIVAARRADGGLEILGVFEVKAGFNGGLEATYQVFDWIEELIDAGCQLVLPAGASFTTAAGVVRRIVKEEAFTYGNVRGAKQFVYNLTNAKRYIVTAKGVSHLGIDSGSQISRTATRIELAYTSEEIDFMIAHLFTRSTGPIKL